MVAELFAAGLAGCVVGCMVRLAVTVRPLAGAKLPHPSKVAGMPMAGPALKKAAHRAINRKKV